MNMYMYMYMYVLVYGMQSFVHNLHTHESLGENNKVYTESTMLEGELGFGWEVGGVGHRVTGWLSVITLICTCLCTCKYWVWVSSRLGLHQWLVLVFEWV